MWGLKSFFLILKVFYRTKKNNFSTVQLWTFFSLYGFLCVKSKNVFCFSIGCIIFILIQFNVFPPPPLRLLIWYMNCLVVCGFVSKCLDIFLLPFSFPSLIPVWSENTLCRLWILVHLLRFVYWPVIWICFSIVYLGTWKECAFCFEQNVLPCQVGLVINVEFISVCDFLFSCSVSCWERGGWGLWL